MIKLAGKIAWGGLARQMGWLAAHSIVSTVCLFFAEGYKGLAQQRVRNILISTGAIKAQEVQVLENPVEKKIDALIDIMKAKESGEEPLIIVTSKMPSIHSK